MRSAAETSLPAAAATIPVRPVRSPPTRSLTKTGALSLVRACVRVGCVASVMTDPSTVCAKFPLQTNHRLPLRTDFLWLLAAH